MFLSFSTVSGILDLGFGFAAGEGVGDAGRTDAAGDVETAGEGEALEAMGCSPKNGREETEQLLRPVPKPSPMIAANNGVL